MELSNSFGKNLNRIVLGDGVTSLAKVTQRAINEALPIAEEMFCNDKVQISIKKHIPVQPKIRKRKPKGFKKLLKIVKDKINKDKDVEIICTKIVKKVQRTTLGQVIEKFFPQSNIGVIKKEKAFTAIAHGLVKNKAAVLELIKDALISMEVKIESAKLFCNSNL